MALAQQPIVVLNRNVERDTGREARNSNIQAAQGIASLIQTTLGPCAMNKLIIDPLGGTTMTNDGNSILREIDVTHPAARHMLELARAQDEEAGDGTTSAIILTAEILVRAMPLLESSGYQQTSHPLRLVQGLSDALQDAVRLLNEFAMPVDPTNPEALSEVIQSCLGTKISGRMEDQLLARLAVDAALRVARPIAPGEFEFDHKRYVKVEKLAGGKVSESAVIDGVMFNKDHIHPKMRRRIEDPVLLLLDSPLEYTKSETAINVELMDENAWDSLLQQEEDTLQAQADAIIALHPTVVVTEKGVSDLSAHFLAAAGITVIRRLRKTDNNRLARFTSATIVHNIEDVTPAHLGRAKLFEIRQMSNEYFTFVTGSPEGSNTKTEGSAGAACSVLLRGPSRDVLNEMERVFHDALCVGRSILKNPRTLLGAGSSEMHVACRLRELGRAGLKSQSPSELANRKTAYEVLANSLEVIPRTLAENCGGNALRLVTSLRALHNVTSSDTISRMGIDGVRGVLADAQSLGIVEPAQVKIQVIKTAVEAASMILRIDEIVSGVHASEQRQTGGVPDD